MLRGWFAPLYHRNKTAGSNHLKDTVYLQILLSKAVSTGYSKVNLIRGQRQKPKEIKSLAFPERIHVDCCLSCQ